MAPFISNKRRRFAGFSSWLVWEDQQRHRSCWSKKKFPYLFPYCAQDLSSVCEKPQCCVRSKFLPVQSVSSVSKYLSISLSLSHTSCFMSRMKNRVRFVQKSVHHNDYSKSSQPREHKTREKSRAPKITINISHVCNSKTTPFEVLK
jgi:hypothetical protein